MALNVGEYIISLDCGEPDANVNFVSHAHSDHTSGLRKDRKVIASKVTKELVEARNPRKKIELIDNLRSVELLNAGHILGSKQLYAESDELGSSVIYSGDYQMDCSLVAEPIETKKADILIIDSTYPNKTDVFGDRAETTAAIQSYLKIKLERGIVLFSSYALGKSQEITKIANEIGICPIVDKRISMINQIYSNNGMKLDYASLEGDDGELDLIARENFLGITSSHNIHGIAQKLSHAYGKRVYTAIASGFAKSYNLGVDVQFPLSDHAGFDQALEYIEACSPKEIYTRGSAECSQKFAKNLASEGYNAAVFTGRIGIPITNKS